MTHIAEKGRNPGAVGAKRLAKLWCLVSLCLSMPATAFLKVPDTVFDKQLDSAVAYETRSLLMKFNYRTNSLAIGPYTGTWKNRKSSGGFLIGRKRKTSTDIVLEHEQHGTWEMFCSGMVKGIKIWGVSFDRTNKVDYQCVMRQGERQVLMQVLPFKQPRISFGPPKENRTVNITLPSGDVWTAASVHALKKSRREALKPVGFEISQGDRVLGGLGRRDKKPVILLNSPADQTEDAHLTFMSALGLQFFMNNDLSETPMDF
ncbi:MAG: hypothetical protein CBC94_001765 [Gammaproteobacteria bacterium TMED134]|nr:MAG: hypothetical protein CBC94_006520 [Gammaproteobacteria bacterium TMED134]RPG47878.1 MAG: hypothetical protein CBC94_001765 [Gammaproteobacteria bacterium TMED134]RZO72211.1 MAG: hypothetical protein EVA67_02410 [OM182 bacterium]HBK19521.1 hypothetical protein [Gammaproteobacteria bacterium]|tara:strand:- start:3911 stop:4693 length:783 start_codon:yes stop_codon:yes gene_type:complete